MVITGINCDIKVNTKYFVSDEQEQDFNKKADEIIKDCVECMKKRLEWLTLLYD